MHLWIALAFLQAATLPTPIDLKCTSGASNAPASFAFRIDLPKESFSVTRNGGAPLTGTAGSYANTVVLELPSSNPNAVPMFFIDLESRTYNEVSRSGASAMTMVSQGTCEKPAASAP